MKIGIALAAFQPELEVFSQQLASIQSQTYPNWVCVITLDSPLHPIANSSLFLPFRSDSRFIWIENPIRLGHKKNFEKGIQEVLKQSVTAIACSDQDDIWYPQKLEICKNVLEKRGKLSLVHSDMHIMRENQITGETAWTLERRGVDHSLPRHFLVRNMVAGCSALFDAELARRFPVIPAGAEYHDHWYALIASFFGGVEAIHQPLYAYRQHLRNEVGVTAFNHIFSRPAQKKYQGFRGILRKCQDVWLKSFQLAAAAQSAGLPLTWIEKIVFLSRFDMGLGFILLGFYYSRNDPALTRACFARALGKVFTLDRGPSM